MATPKARPIEMLSSAKPIINPIAMPMPNHDAGAIDLFFMLSPLCVDINRRAMHRMITA
jgi:hypothetical protein